MGRWRDAVVVSRGKTDAIDPKRLEELFIDQTSSLVGRDQQGVYLAEEFELNGPILVDLSIPVRQLIGLEYVDKRGWVERESGRREWNLTHRTRENYDLLLRAVARRFSGFPLGLDFYSFLRGEVLYTAPNPDASIRVAVTPIHVVKKRYDYEADGVRFPEW